MTRLSEYFLPTERQPPADAEATSHKLMVRAGLIRQVGAGLWSWLPAGWRVHQRAVQIVREEIDAIGGQEMLMPVLHPAEYWRRSGRYDIDELFKLEDRKGSELVLAMTHEEIVTAHVAQVVRSYRDLPLILYHFSVKERDEPRPRAGVLRTREFIMKDSYTFDADAEGLAASYDRHIGAYDRIFDRCGLEWYRVESDVGMMGGLGAHEYMAPCPAGENEVALAGGYAANVEIASAEAQPVELPEPLDEPEPVDTPALTTVDEVAGALGVAPGALLKAYPVMVEERGLVMALVRGDHRVNEIKLRNALGAAFRPAHPDEVAERIGPAGFIGPVGAQVPILLDDAVGVGGYVTGANRPDAHLRGVQPGRHFPFERADVRRVEPGDRANGQAIRIEAAIEVGNIFKLGTRYSEAFGATYLDEAGREQPIWMGSYGIGPARIAAAAVEQHADGQGIAWPRALAPFDIHLVGLGQAGSAERAAADELYEALVDAGLDVLYDERDAGPGEKFADAELLGCPLRLTVGRRTLEGGELEVQVRRGPPPPDTLAGHPLHPWTLPNAIEFARLALIPVFLVLAMSSQDGQDALPAAIFAVVAGSDYLDGLAARLTGQYSRLGALMDPVVDRLLVLAGVAVCWRFDLLPRWALAVLIAREVAVVALARYGLSRGLDLRINWPGRLAVWPTMSAIAFALIGLLTLGEVLLYIGLALGLAALAMYYRDGMVALRKARLTPSSSA